MRLRLWHLNAFLLIYERQAGLHAWQIHVSSTEVQGAVSIPVMAKARIGHISEARVLEAMGVDYIDESEVLTPADEEFHLLKSDIQCAVCLWSA